MRMRWVDLLFAHWPVDPDALRPLIPRRAGAGHCSTVAPTSGIVPFLMEDVGPRFLPAPPVAGAFPELNVRTYVRHEGSAPASGSSAWTPASRVAVEGARTAFHLPYFDADMSGRARARGRRLPVGPDG